MKKISIYIFLLFAGISTAFAQLDRSTYPAPGPAPEINIGDPTTFTLANGLKVFVVENHKLPRVTYSLVIDRDPLFEGDKAGLTSLFGEMLSGGTTSRTKVEFDEAIDQIGANISFSSTSANASGLTKYNDQLLTLFADALFNPAFPETELDKLKKQYISALAMQKDEPESIANRVSNAVLYGKDHPYGESETEKTYENISVEDVRAYYETYFRPNVAYLAIVGNITPAEAEAQVKKYFNDWEQAEVPRHEWATPQAPQGTQVILVDRPTSAQSVISIGYPLELKPSDKDAIAASVVSSVLGGGASGRLFQNLREDKGYTYGAYGSLSADRLIGNVSTSASVGTGVTDSAAHEFIYELRRLGEKTITEEELALSKAVLAGRFGRSLEQPATIARFAINTDRYNLPADYYQNYLKNLDAITLDEINEIAAKYINGDNLYITVVGKTEEFADKLAGYGPIQYLSPTGDPVVKTEITDASITAESVIEKYLTAIGGREKLESVKTLKQLSSAEIQGMQVAFELFVDKEKGKAVQNVKAMGQVMAKTAINGDKVSVTAQGQTQELPAEATGAFASYLQIFPELYFATAGASLELDGIEQVEGEDSYKLKITDASGSKVEFFSVASGLKLKTESETTGAVTYHDYTDYDGILFPKVTSLTLMGMPVKAETTENTINGPISDAELN